MLQTNYHGSAIRPAGLSDGKVFPGVPLENFDWRQFLRHARMITLCILVCVALGLAYVNWRTPAYTAATSLLIDHKVVQFLRDDAIYGAAGVDEALLQNQVAILRSEAIALKVIDSLKLANEDAHMLHVAAEREILSDLSSNLQTATVWVADKIERVLPISMGDWLLADAPMAGSSGTDRLSAALQTFHSNLSVEAPGRDHTITIGYTAPDPELAASIANEVARVYLEDQREVSNRAAGAASAWLREKVAELGTSARILSPARPNDNPIGLGSGIVIAASVVGGLMLGIVGAFWREVTGRRVYTPEEAAAAAGAPCLGGLPRVRGRSVQRRKKAADRISDQRLFQQENRVFSWALEFPLSGFAHGIDRLSIAVTDDAGSRGGLHRTIGITSITAGEGKTVIAANLAQVLAARGLRVLLIDAVPHNRGLSSGFSINKGVGLLDVLAGTTKLSDAVGIDPGTGLHFLRLSAFLPQQMMSGQIWCRAMEQLIKDEQYDSVVVDLPPLGLVPDAVAAAQFLDGFVLVVERAGVPVECVSRTLAAAGSVQDRLIGVVLNKISASSWQALVDGQWLPHRSNAPYGDHRYK